MPPKDHKTIHRLAGPLDFDRFLGGRRRWAPVCGKYENRKVQ